MTQALATEPQALITGWEDEVDAGDTVLRRFLVHFGENFASAATALDGRVVRRPELCVADRGQPSAYWNSAVILQPPAPDAWDDVLHAAEDGFATGQGDAYLWSAWPTPDLSARGWQLMGYPPVMVRPPGGTLPPAATGLMIAEVDSETGLEDWARVAVEGYPFDDMAPYRPGSFFDRRILADRRWRFWVGYDEDQPVAIGTLFVSHGLAEMSLGVTLPYARGRGFWYALVRERLLAEPDLLSGGVFSDSSRPGMQRLGYLPVVRLTLWQRSRPE